MIVDRPLAPYETIAGADVSYNKRSPTLYAAVVVLRADTSRGDRPRGGGRRGEVPVRPGSPELPRGACR